MLIDTDDKTIAIMENGFLEYPEDSTKPVVMAMTQAPGY